MPGENVEGTGSPGSRTGDQQGSVFQRASSDWGTFKGTLGDLGKDKSLEPIKDFKGLTESFVNAQKMIGGSIRLPAKDLKPEDRKKAVNDIISKLRAGGDMEAIPESPDKYEIKMPTEEGWKVNEPLHNSFRQVAHKFGIAPSQAQGLFDWYLNFQAEADRQEEADFVNIKEAMKKEFGGLYVRRMEAARRAAGKYIGEDADEIISQLPPKIGQRLVKAFALIGEPLLEDAIISGELPGMTKKEDVKAKIDAMMNDPKHALNDISHVGHKEAVDEYTRLQQMYIKMSPKK